MSGLFELQPNVSRLAKRMASIEARTAALMLPSQQLSSTVGAKHRPATFGPRCTYTTKRNNTLYHFDVED